MAHFSSVMLTLKYQIEPLQFNNFATESCYLLSHKHTKKIYLFDFCGYQKLLEKTHGQYQDIPN
jgi:hypothetical protein